MTAQIGLYKFKLTQKHYNEGAFYLSAVLDGEQVNALDARFYLDEGNKLTPTKNGFRIRIDKLDDFRKLLNGDLREIDDTVLFSNNSFRFHIRYVNDKYGEGIDLRKYKTKDKYTGWDRSGIRMKPGDVTTMRDWLNSFDQSKVSLSCDIFSDKDIARKENGNSGNGKSDQTIISPAIKQIIEF